MRARRFRQLARVLGAVCFAALAISDGMAQAPPLNSEPQLKAAYLVNFLKYVEWPGSSSTATICLFGHDTLGLYLAPYEGRMIGGRELRVRRITNPTGVAE